MPLYVFVCEEGHAFEEYASFHDRDKIVPCPICQAPAKRDFMQTAKQVIIQVPLRHRADREIEIVRTVVGETRSEREKFKQMVENGRFINKTADSPEYEFKDEERRITRELWEEARRLTDNGRLSLKELGFPKEFSTEPPVELAEAPEVAPER